MASTPLVTRAVTITSQGSNGQTLSETWTVIGNAEWNYSENLIIGTNVQFVQSIVHTDIICFDGIATTATTVDFNSSGSPAPALALGPNANGANVQAHWDSLQYAVNNTAWPNPFTADITQFYVTNAAATILNLSFLLTIVA